MLVAERQKQIVDLINQKGSVRVSELSRLFAVTEETIRRDLDLLEHRRQLCRSHGGAVRMQQVQPETPYSEREITNVREKEEIARQAVQYIETRDRIVLDASTTAWYMAKIMPNIPLTVVTNSIKVAIELSGKEKIEVISTGGILSSRSLSYVGPLAEKSLQFYHVNKAFISCKGLHLQKGMSESNELQMLVKRQMIEMADEVNVMVDYSKFGVQAFAQMGSLKQVNRVITDSQTPIQQITALQEQRILVKQVQKGGL